MTDFLIRFRAVALVAALTALSVGAAAGGATFTRPAPDRPSWGATCTTTTTRVLTCERTNP